MIILLQEVLCFLEKQQKFLKELVDATNFTEIDKNYEAIHQKITVQLSKLHTQLSVTGNPNAQTKTYEHSKESLKANEHTKYPIAESECGDAVVNEKIIDSNRLNEERVEVRTTESMNRIAEHNATLNSDDTILEIQLINNEKQSGHPQNFEHIDLHDENNRLECILCDRLFSTHMELKTHIIKHANEKLFRCDICLKKFSQLSHLEAHTRLHSEDRPFACSTCGIKFLTKATLHRHKKIHTGEKAFQCSICERKFSRKSHLKEHSLIHSGEKPHECPICGKRTSRKSNLKIHILTHKKEDSI